MDQLEFREVSLANLDEIAELRVRPEQAHLVADNLYSIAQAGLDPTGFCRGVYVNGEPAGFLFVRMMEEGRLAYICRFMVDQQWQRQGIGRRILRELVAFLFTSPAVETIDLAVARDAGGAEEFYRKSGFRPTEERYRGGWRMVLHRADYASADPG